MFDAFTMPPKLLQHSRAVNKGSFHEGTLFGLLLCASSITASDRLAVAR